MPALRVFLRFILPAALVAGLLPVLAAPSGAASITFSNPSPINFPTGFSTASPYPSSIVVSGVGIAGDVNVTLNNASHTFTSDVDVLLVNPTGQGVVLAADTGSGGDWIGTTLTFDDGAPPLSCGSVNTPTGTYSPTNCSAFNGPAPAPSGPYGAQLSDFDGTNADGVWSLYVFDDFAPQDGGSINGGWSITIRQSPVLSVADITVTEGDSGTLNATFTLSLNEPAFKLGTVDFYTTDGTAKAPGDYQSRTGSRVWLAGQRTKKVTVPVNGDTAQEGNETFFLKLIDEEGIALPDNTAMATIVDNDQPAISIDDVSATEVNQGSTKVFTFHVTLNHAGTNTVTVNYATADGSATAPADYAAKSGTVTFSPGVVSKTIKITTKGDNALEPNETFFVNLSSPTFASIADNQGVGTIVNND